MLCLIILILAGAGNAPAEGRKITRTVLDNGLTVVMEEDRSAPVVALQMWVRVGSADEKEGEYGLAHVFEHMLFKGTAKRGVGRIASETEAAGGNINAYTSFDTTVYHITLPSRNFGIALDIMSDAIQNSSFDPDELKKELEVVTEEIRMGEDRPERKLYKTVFDTSYTTHPYRRPVIGTEESVGKFTREQILEFFKKWYIPNNMTLVIAGDVDAEKAVELAKKSFKDFTRKDDPRSTRPVEPPQDSLKSAVKLQPINTTHLAMAFHIPSLKHEDVYALDVLASVLGDGVTGRLYKRLKIEKELVNSVTAYAMAPKEPGLFMILLSLDSSKVNESANEVIEELKRMSLEGPSAKELDKAKLSLESSFIYSRETMDGKADQLGYYESSAGDLSYEKKYLVGIRGVEKDDVQMVLKKYLNKTNMTIVAVAPESDGQALKEKALGKAVNKAWDKKLKQAKKEARNNITKIKLENGITVIVKEDYSNPTVAMYAAFPGGLRFETKTTNGIGNFTAAMLTYGTKKMNRIELATEIEGMAGGINGFSGRNSSGVQANFLSKFFDKGLTLFADVVQNPSFPEDEMEKLRKDILAAIKKEEDYLPGYTFKLLYRELYKKHPYGMTVSGAPEVVSALKKEDLARHYDAIFVPSRMILTIVGDVSADYAVEKIKDAFKGFDRKAGPMPALAIDALPQGILSTGEYKDKAQTNIGMGFIGPTALSKDVYATEVLTEILSGQGGRLFIELRDKKSLAYALSAFSRPGVEPGTFGVYIGTAPGKKEAAITGITEELKKITEEKVSGDELERAKGSLTGNHDMSLQSVSAQASDMANNELLGLGYDNFGKYAKNIDSVTTEDVLVAAKKYITLDRYVISIVGPEDKKKEEETREGVPAPAIAPAK